MEQSTFKFRVQRIEVGTCDVVLTINDKVIPYSASYIGVEPMASMIEICSEMIREVDVDGKYRTGWADEPGGLDFTFNQQDNTQSIPESTGSNGDTVDEIINSQEEEVHYKRVDFNGLFNMYLPEDSNVVEYGPQNNATYEWESGIFFIMYYDQYTNVNQIVSLLMDENPTLSYSTEGNLVIVDNFKVNGVDNMGYVIVQSPDNKFVVIFSRGDLETTKTLANSVVFD